MYYHDATQPSAVDKPTFAQFSTNIIVGPLGPVKETRNVNTSKLEVTYPQVGVAIYNGASPTPSVNLTVSALKKILK
jgi:hypothetical protein